MQVPLLTCGAFSSTLWKTQGTVERRYKKDCNMIISVGKNDREEEGAGEGHWREKGSKRISSENEGRVREGVSQGSPEKQNQ